MLKKSIISLLAIVSVCFAGCSVSGTSVSDSSIDSSTKIEESTASTSSTEETIGSVGLTYVANNGGGYTVTGIGACTDSVVVIPATYNGKAVTEIGEEAFAFTEGVEKVTIPSLVVSIQPNAFYFCADLVSVTFEQSDGWQVLAIASLISGDAVSLANDSENVTLLTDTYRTYYWKYME